MILSLVVKEEGIIKMVGGSTCEIIGTGIVKVTERDRTVRALKAVRYVLETRYNLISIRVLETRRRHSQPRRQDNPERREVWRVIQAE